MKDNIGHKNLHFLITLLAGCLFTSGLTAQSGHTLLRQGDRNYKSQDYGKAEESYRKALEKEPSARGKYNLGNTIYKQDRYDEAVKRYEEAANSASDPALKSRAFHNLGNAYFQQKEFDKSIEAYKNALRLNPSDLETKYNLALAQKFLPPPPPPQQNNDENQQDQNQQDQNQQQQNNDQQQQDQQQQQQQQQQEQQNQSQDQQNSQEGQSQNQPMKEKELTEEDIKQLLRSIAEEEKKTLEKLRQADAGACRSTKAW